MKKIYIFLTLVLIALKSMGQFSVTITHTNCTGNGICDGTATAVVNGGTAPYTYSWSSSQSTSTVTGLCAGTYSLVVVDSIGSWRSDTTHIDQPVGIRSIIFPASTHFELYPNPNNGNFNIGFTQNFSNDVSVEIINMLGEKIYSEQLNNFSGRYEKEISLNNYAKGIYMLQLKSRENIVCKKIIKE